MIIVDVNLLLYAYDASSRHHQGAKSWWEERLSEIEIIGLSWATLLSFVRISTNARILLHPFSLNEAIAHVNSWLERPMVQMVHPGHDHWKVLSQVLIETNSSANYIPDAHLAVLAIENGAKLCSSDHDFARFKNVTWINPLKGRSGEAQNGL